MEFDHFEDAQRFAPCGAPTHPLVLLACPNDLLDPFLPPSTANRFACPLAATVSGRTIIEKFEDYSDVGFAIALLTPDDRAGTASAAYEEQKPRARQN